HGRPGMVWKIAVVQPVTPELRRPVAPSYGVGDVRRGLALRPGESGENRVAGFQSGAGGCAVAFEAEAHVGGQLDPRVAPGRLGDTVSRTRVRPGSSLAAVVENGLAVEAELNRAIHAMDGAEQDVLGLVVRGGPPVALAARLGSVPGADQERVQHLDPAAPGP